MQASHYALSSAPLPPLFSGELRQIPGAIAFQMQMALACPAALQVSSFAAARGTAEVYPAQSECTSEVPSELGRALCSLVLAQMTTGSTCVLQCGL